MRAFVVLPAAVLALAVLLAAGSPAADVSKSGKDTPVKAEGSCGNHGTSVDFLDTPSAAARKALKEQKLVFVLHVSGHFEDPRLT
jgi:hypothetical protein